MAAFDFFGTIVVSVIITFLLSRFTSLKTPWYLILLLVFVVLFVLGILFHWLFCVPTNSNKILGLA